MAWETPRKYQRYSAETWRALLAQQAKSGLTIAAFCRQIAVSTATFYRWQGMLQQDGGVGRVAVADRTPVATTARHTPVFVDLGALEDLAPSTPREDAAHPRTELRLELGGGLVLHVVRG